MLLSLFLDPVRDSRDLEIVGSPRRFVKRQSLTLRDDQSVIGRKIQAVKLDEQPDGNFQLRSLCIHGARHAAMTDALRQPRRQSV